MQRQQFDSWQSLLTWLSGLPGFNSRGFEFGGKLWSRYYKIVKKAPEHGISVLGPGADDGSVLEPQVIGAFAKVGGKSKTKVIYGLGTYIKMRTKSRNEMIARNIKGAFQFSPLGQFMMKRKIAKMRAEMAEEDWDLDESAAEV